MANLNVSYADIEATVSRLQQGQSDLNQELQNLKAQVDDLVSSGFITDKASGAFQQSYQEFTDGATKTVNGLEGICDYLNKAQQAMQELDSQLASQLQ
ncbi:type VII secretion protein [Pseudoscardovia radai]|uniref:ESAT-6-like protein n=1 Tax=Pseudoscardovia radai TaxID=987066 RepID=A0A261EWQ8_9BIFI|nr:WXG100 family type VII secretion target [Pseudoscardovia radai]OZG51281.1 type VII secretion protein [Pseudoscardovia radai]